MFIQKGTAKKIIHEISTVLDYDINIMNEEGIIIASTDPNRVDCFHEAAYKIIREHLSELMVYYDEEYKGCRKGINLPILMESNIIGVIGMTGEVDEITKYGRILKKMTEIMALDIFDLHQKSIKEQKKMFFIHDIMNGNNDPHETESQLKKYGFNDKDPYTAIIFNPNSLLEKYTVKNTISASIGDTGVAISQMPHKQLTEKLSFIVDATEDARFFVGYPQSSHNDIKKSFDTAEKASEYHHFHSNLRLIFYEDNIVDIALCEIGSDEKEKCIEKIFKNCSNDEINDYINFINIYSEHNGSINKIANTLYVHKNTVQYKINKIQMKTGLNMRCLDDFFMLKLASKWLTIKTP